MMKLSALTALAVFGALLPIAYSGRFNYEEYSCKNLDAKTGETVKSCDYWCLESEEATNYIKKYYPDGTSCKYTSELTSKCKDKQCHHPSSSVYQQGKSGKDKADEDGGKRAEDNEEEKEEDNKDDLGKNEIEEENEADAEENGEENGTEGNEEHVEGDVEEDLGEDKEEEEV